MAWCRQATSHYLTQCWPRCMLPYGVTRPQWVNLNSNFSDIWGTSPSFFIHHFIHHNHKKKLSDFIFSVMLNMFIMTFNSLRPSDTIWRQRTGSTLAQVVACCLTTPSHYMNQCWLIITKVLWLSYEGNFARDASIINHWNLFENYMSKISFKFPRGRWVKCELYLCHIHERWHTAVICCRQSSILSVNHMFV